MNRSRRFISSALFWCAEELLLRILTPVCVLMVLMVFSVIIWKLCFPSSWQITSSERSSWSLIFRQKSPTWPTWVVLTLILLLDTVSPWFTKSGPVWDHFFCFFFPGKYYLDLHGKVWGTSITPGSNFNMAASLINVEGKLCITPWINHSVFWVIKSRTDSNVQHLPLQVLLWHADLVRWSAGIG